MLGQVRLTDTPPSTANALPVTKVFLLVGTTAIPLGVEHRFKDVAGALPKPGELPIDDAHDKKHDSHTYCYRFGAKGSGLLEFFDSDFGLHTARLSRIGASSENGECPELRSEPRFAIGGKTLSLAAKGLPDLPGFTKEEKEKLVLLKKAWTYTDVSKQHQWGNCFSREVAIEARPDEGGFRSIRVMNWDEPGC